MLATNRGVQVWDATTLFVAGSSGRILVGSSPIRSGVANSLALRWAGDRPLLAVIQERENQLWDVTDPRHPGVVFTAPAPKWWAGAATTLSPDGSVLAVAEALSDTRWVLRLRDTANPHGEPLATVDTLANGVAALAFSPTTRLLAVSDHNSESGNSHSPPTIRVYDLTDRRHPRQVAQFDATSGHLAFAPSSAVLTATVTGSQGDLRMRSWDLNEPGRPVELWSRPLTPGQQFASIAYRPDGAYLAVFEGTGILRLWPVNQHRLVGDPLTVRVAGAAGSDVVFSRDGTRLALMATEYSVTRSARAEIWDVTTPESPVRQSSLPIDSTALDPTSLAFSPDGATLAVARRDGIDLLDTRPDQIAKSLCAAVGDPITQQEWDRYLPGRPYQPPCP
jgi:WD40 repeat protein